MQYKRVLLKLSGEALMGNRQYGIDPERLAEYAEEVKSVTNQGVEVAIVIGGGLPKEPVSLESANEITCWLCPNNFRN